jgi:hypothetical protein
MCTNPAASGEGRLPLLASAFVLLFSGLFALYVGVTGQFLPHDERFLGMTSEALCAVHGCRIVHFMVHDRVSFGGALVAIGLLYLWLIESPLREGRAWAWWLLVLSGVVGFSSFLAYLSYGYLDTWHGAATVGLLPCFAFGIVRSRRALSHPKGVWCLLRPSADWPRVGRACLLVTAAGMVGGGLTILVLGSTCVFVPQDLAYMGLGVEDLQALNPRLVPLIAHDRAGFGGAVCCCGVILFFTVWCATPSRSLWRVLALAGAGGFGAAIAVHPAIGYVDAGHLAPAAAGALLYAAGMTLTFRTPTFGIARDEFSDAERR